MAMICAATAIAGYAFWRVDKVQQNIETVNRIYVPTLKQLNLVSGKWSAYQRAFEQSVAFRKWGEKNNRGPSNLRLKKIIEANIFELERIIAREGFELNFPEKERMSTWVARLSSLSEREQGINAEITAFVQAKRFIEAAATYSRIRQEQLELTQTLAGLTAEIENGLSLLQLSTEQELRHSQSVVLLLLVMSIAFSLAVLFRLRRWFSPVFEWTSVAKEIALKGIQAGQRFPQITRSMPSELAVLTREFSRMARTILEREKTIGEQKHRLELQNEKLTALGGKLSHARKLALVGEMSSQIAHEVRNPLNSIALQLEMLEEDLQSAPAVKRVRLVAEQVERLERITKSYLDMAKSKIRSAEPVNLHEVIENCVEFMSSELQVARVRIVLDLAAENARVNGDADALSQVIFNLVRNSIDALAAVPEERKAIRIATAEKNGEISVRVEDSGHGIAEELREKLFEPFLTTKTSGHGLGLSVSRQICIDHGGELKLMPAAVGACFEFNLKGANA